MEDMSDTRASASSWVRLIHAFAAWLDTASFVSLHCKKVVANLFSARNHLPPQTGHIYTPHQLDRSRRHPSMLLLEKPLQLIRIDILRPLVRSTRHHPQQILGHQFRRQPTRPSPGNRADHQPTSRAHKRQAGAQERLWPRHMLDDLEQRQHIVLLLARRR